MKRHLLILGCAGGVLIALLRWSEYQFLVIDHSVEIYAALVAIVFAGLGIWLGVKLTRPRAGAAEPVQADGMEPVQASGGQPFVPDDKSRDDLGITRREMEILGLVARA